MAPDFYLASTEGYRLEQPRAAFALRRLHGNGRRDFLVIRIAPPLPGDWYGLGDVAIDTLVLATRHEGASMFPISAWPLAVHVALSKVANVEQRARIQETDLVPIAWAELYPTEEAASEAVHLFEAARRRFEERN
jgi:hypothetical protein